MTTDQSNVRALLTRAALYAALAFATGEVIGCKDGGEDAPPDSGFVALRDGSARDASEASDGGGRSDAGSVADAGIGIDGGGANSDAGGSFDAGEPPDAGALPDGAAGTDAGGASDAGPPPVDAFVSCVGERGCFACTPTTTLEFLNHCTTTDCSPFDNEARLPLYDEGSPLPPLP